MPGLLDPFTPGQDTTPFAGVEPGMFDKIRGEWGAFLSDPKGRAAMMSVGLALMQPPSFGDNAPSQIGRAVGSAGQSAQLMEAQDLKRGELESKDAERESRAGLRESQGMLAEARASTAGARSDAAADRVRFQREKLATDSEFRNRALESQDRERQSRAELRVAQAEAMLARTGTQEARNELARARLDLSRMQQEATTERNLLGNRVRLSSQYQNYVRDVAKRNNDPLRTGTPEPVLPMGDWIRANPVLRDSGIVPQSEEDDTSVPSAADTTSLPQANPNDPNRRPGRYMTPRGPMTWTGTGWVP